MTGSAVAPATMTCCSGSSVSSAVETTNEADAASFSSSTIVGSALTSFSNCSSGRSGRIFLPSGPITGTSAAGAASSAFFAAAVFAAPVLLAGAAFFAGAAFLAGAAVLAAAAVFAGAAFLAGAFLAVLAVAVLRVLVAATARPEAGIATVMPRPARWPRNDFRCGAATSAEAHACRTSSGLTLPIGVA